MSPEEFRGLDRKECENGHFVLSSFAAFLENLLGSEKAKLRLIFHRMKKESDKRLALEAEGCQVKIDRISGYPYRIGQLADVYKNAAFRRV